jgi:hypothetical protein
MTDRVRKFYEQVDIAVRENEGRLTERGKGLLNEMTNEELDCLVGEATNVYLKMYYSRFKKTEEKTEEKG